MPKFTVYGGHDAYAIYQCVVDADTPDEARQIAKSTEQYWRSTGDTSVFDDFEVFEGEGSVVPYDPDEHVERGQYALSGIERNMILAALRLWQESVNDGSEYLHDGLIAVATNNHVDRMLDDTEIDALCERINV